MVRCLAFHYRDLHSMHCAWESQMQLWPHPALSPIVFTIFSFSHTLIQCVGHPQCFPVNYRQALSSIKIPCLWFCFMCIGCFAFMYVYVPHACLVLMVTRKGHQIFLELELQTVMRHHMDDGNHPTSLNSKCLYLLSNLFSHSCIHSWLGLKGLS